MTWSVTAGMRHPLASHQQVGVTSLREWLIRVSTSLYRLGVTSAWSTSTLQTFPASTPHLVPNNISEFDAPLCLVDIFASEPLNINMLARPFTMAVFSAFLIASWALPQDSSDSVRITGDGSDSVRITGDGSDSVRITGDAETDSVRIT